MDMQTDGRTDGQTDRKTDVTFTCKLSLSEHVSVIVTACAPTLHALRALRSHGMNDAALQTIYKAVVVAKLTYAASVAVWCGFTSADDRRRIEAVDLRYRCIDADLEVYQPATSNLVPMS